MREYYTFNKQERVYFSDKKQEFFYKDEISKERLPEVFYGIAHIYLESLQELLKSNKKFSKEDVSDKIKDYLALQLLPDMEKLANYYVAGATICSAHCRTMIKAVEASFIIQEGDKADLIKASSDLEDNSRQITGKVLEEIKQKFEQLDKAKTQHEQDKITYDVIKENKAEGLSVTQALENFDMSECIYTVYALENNFAPHASRLAAESATGQNQAKKR
ncbi:hypothetical protein RLOatenuis_7370 [Rickettsiales bacterium]|nr:hypothetical protein RLOatenuis_7370 [Rickettsiales bacterium]